MGLRPDATFNDVWDYLKVAGWKHKNGTLASYCYLMPGVTKKSEGVWGVDMFDGEDAVMEYLRAHPEAVPDLPESEEEETEEEEDLEQEEKFFRSPP